MRSLAAFLVALTLLAGFLVLLIAFGFAASAIAGAVNAMIAATVFGF